MKIVVTSNYKIGNETGTSHIADGLSRELAKKHQVTYICPGERYQISKINARFTILTIPSVEINEISVPLITPTVMFDVFKYLNSFNPDVVHAQNPFLISDLAQRWTNKNTVPFIVTFHHVPTQAIEHILPKFSKNLVAIAVQNIYKEVSLKRFLEKTDAVIALNENVKKSIREIDKNIPINVINNGLDLKRLQNIGIKDNFANKINFVSLGSYTERKNQKYLINVFSHLPKNYILKLYGRKKTGGIYFKDLSKLLDRLKLKNVFLEDYTDNLPEVLKWADFFITSSLKEVQSLAIIESLAAGRPVIGLKNETVSELINNKNGLGLSLNTPPEIFAMKLLKFIRTIDYRKLAVQSRQDSQKFNIKIVSSKIEEYYKTIIFRAS
jgi:glycosyltransferase involved in cell wall biosynthesis